jgi:N-acetylmuramic acid 6-phosphate etherase
MIDMQLSNKKLVQRGIEMIVEELNISNEEAAKLLEQHQSVRAVLLAMKK